MTIEDSNVEKVINHLSQMFRSGNNWVAFPTSEDKDELFFFKEVNEANSFCASKLNDAFQYQFSPVTNFTRDLTGASSTSKYVTEDLSKYYEDGEVTSVLDPAADLTAMLSNGNYHAVNYLREFFPSESIDKYIILERDQDSNKEKGIFVEYKAWFEDYIAAVNALWAYKDERCGQTNVGVDFKIVGQMKGLALQVNTDGEPIDRSGLVCLTANLSVNESGQKTFSSDKSLGFDWMPITLKEPMMAKINKMNHHLEFFNGKLEKVNPFTTNVYLMNFDYLSKESIKSKNTIKLDENMTAKEKNKHAHRFKPGL